MQFLIATIAALAATVTAAPAAGVFPRQASVVCTGTYNTPQCCAVDVLGLADLNCANPPHAVQNQTQFIDDCAVSGQQARCCLLPVLDQALICGAPLETS